MWPLIPHGQSDTACLDNALELLLAGGVILALALLFWFLLYVVRRGDRITSIDDAAISNLTELRLAMWYRQPGDTIRLGILRPRLLLKDKVMTHEITLK